MLYGANFCTRVCSCERTRNCFGPFDLAALLLGSLKAAVGTSEILRLSVHGVQETSSNRAFCQHPKPPLKTQDHCATRKGNTWLILGLGIFLDTPLMPILHECWLRCCKPRRICAMEHLCISTEIPAPFPIDRAFPALSFKTEDKLAGAWKIRSAPLSPSASMVLRKSKSILPVTA